MKREDIAALVTWMYVPADQRDKLDKALKGEADAIIADLEDAVAILSKDKARATLAEWLDDLPADRPSQPAIWVRVNSTMIDADLAVGVHPAVAGVCLPKAESAGSVAAFAAAVADLDGSRRSGADGTALMLMIETGRGVVDCVEIAAASEQVVLLQLGEQDLSADLGLPPALEPGPLPWTLQAARDAVVLASAANHLLPPIGPVSTVIHDSDALRTEARQLRRDGFGGRANIHPAQLGPAADGFAPTDAELQWAQRVVDADDEAKAAGRGVTLVDNRMVDAPVVAQARRILRRSP